MAAIKFGHILAADFLWIYFTNWQYINCIISFGYILQIDKNKPISFVHILPADLFWEFEGHHAQDKNGGDKIWAHFGSCLVGILRIGQKFCGFGWSFNGMRKVGVCNAV